MIRKTSLALAALVLVAFNLPAADVLRIRKTAGNPFAAGDSAWERADRLVGFIEPEKLDVAMDQTEARLLYDGKILYARLTGKFDAQYEAKEPEGRLFHDNHFELLVADSRKVGDFRQFAFSEGGLVYSGVSRSGSKREFVRTPAFSYEVKKGKGSWTAEVALPLSDLGLEDAAVPGRRIALLIARGNRNTANGKMVHSAWAALSQWNYTIPSQWGEVEFAADDATEPRSSFGPDNGEKVNYFSNPDFDLPGGSWEIVGKGDTLRMETMAMSGEWIYRTSGESYQFLKGTPAACEGGTEYTMAVTARSFGGKAVMNVLELNRRADDGKVIEGAHVADNIVLGTEFHTYYFNFTTYPGTPLYFLFYKWDPKDAANIGIDIASVRLCKGKISPLEVRSVSRSGRKEPVGAGVPMAENRYGRAKERLRALVFMWRYRDLREGAEPFAGLNADVDVLVTTAPDQDTFETDSDEKAVLARLEKGEYDLIVLAGGTASRIGVETAALIEAAVRNGTGLYAQYYGNPHRLSDLLKAANCVKLPADHPLRDGFPFTTLTTPTWTTYDPAYLSAGKLGKGVVLAETRGYQGEFKLRMKGDQYGHVDFPFGSFADAWLARLFRYAARKGDPVADPVARALWRTYDLSGVERGSGEAANAASAFAAAQAAGTTAGRHVAEIRTLDADGNTIDWDARAFDREGATISSLVAVRDSCVGDTPAILQAEITGNGADLTLVWTLEDFSGRVLERGHAEPGRTFDVPVRSLYTNLGIVRVELRDGDEVRDTRRLEVYARDRDGDRTFDDFTVGVWGHRGSCSRDTYPLIDRRLEEIGVRHQLLPVDDAYVLPSMANGMAVGGGYLGPSNWLVAQKTDGSNCRTYGPINTEEGHTYLAQRATKQAKAVAKYGVTQYTACDEPNLAERFTTDEPDETPENVAVYRQRIAARYGDIAAYNLRHRTTYASFDEVGPVRLADARKNGDYAGYVEWRSFNVDRWCEALKVLADNGRAADPTCRMSLFDSFGQTAASGNDYWKLLTKAGLDFSNEYTAMVSMRRDPLYNFDEFYRSFRPDMRVWGFTGYSIGTEQIMFTPWWFAAHRYGGLTWFSAVGWGWHLVDLPTLAFVRDAADLKTSLESSRMLDGLGKACLAYDWAPRQIALYYSHESLLVATLLGEEKQSYEILSSGPLHDYMYSRQGAQYLVEDLLYQHDFVAPEQVLAGALAGRRVLFMPRILALSDAEVTALKAFLQGGGRIVADQLPGDYDELGIKRAANPFEGDPIEIFGKNFDDLDTAQRTRVLALLEEAGVEPILRSDGIAGVYGREAMRFTDGTNDFYCVIRMPSRSEDAAEQTFVFPKRGHVYDVRQGAYLGETDRVTAAVPHAGACVWAVLPYRATALEVAAPAVVDAGEDLAASLSLGDTAVGTHVFHVEVVPPSGECRFHFKRNLVAKGGRADFTFRIAWNDQPGEWHLRVTDVLTGLAADRTFTVRSGLAKIPVVLTIDDNLKDHLDYFAPALERRGWRGVFNVVSDWVGKGSNRLTWDDIRELRRRGHEITNHTKSHPDIADLVATGAVERARQELVESRDAISRELGEPVRYLCLPFTHGSPAVTQLAEEAGLEVFSVKREVCGSCTLAGTDNGPAAIVEKRLAAGAKAIDFMLHGVRKEGGGYMRFETLADFEAFLDEIAACRDRIVVTDYATAAHAVK